LVILAGALFVLGALGLEMIHAQTVSAYGDNGENLSGIPKVVAGLQTSLEEMFEMLGITIFIYALLSYVGSYVKEVTVRVRVGDK
jgi:hypothetical protein